MNKYEVTYIVDTNLGEDATTALMETMAEHVKKQEGEVTQIKPWGKRRFAYEMKNKREGLYVTMHFAASPDGMAEVRRQMTLSEDILRSLFLSVN